MGRQTDGRMAVSVRAAVEADLPATASTYLAAFPDTLEQLHAQSLRPAALVDAMRICLRAEPGAFLVAEVGGEPAGYAICPARTDRVTRTAILGGHVWRILWRFCTGQYGIGLTSGMQALADKLHFLRSDRLPGADCRARVLSIAVSPAFQGRGIGRELLQAGLAYLRSQGTPCVRLEVRPANTPAKHLYETVGFETVGQIHDTRGPWDVMMLRTAAAPQPQPPRDVGLDA